ncbi:MAG TPA: hypothetical protein GXX72_07660 [Clostridiaceae bacterium]|nr:hypothetical protein [Clostridiaceae bacterium]
MLRKGLFHTPTGESNVWRTYTQQEPGITEFRYKPESVVNIYLAASDKDLLSHVNRILHRKGMMGTVDMSGRVQLVLDGRKGASYAAGRLSDYTNKTVASFREQLVKDDVLIEQSIDTILKGYGFRTRLRGYALLRRMLFLAVRDPALISPATKRLYPIIAEEFRATLPQIERNLRYLVQTLLSDEKAALAQGATQNSKKFWLSRNKNEKKPTVISTLTKLHDQVLQEYRSAFYNYNSKEKHR